MTLNRPGTYYVAKQAERKFGVYLILGRRADNTLNTVEKGIFRLRRDANSECRKLNEYAKLDRERIAKEKGCWVELRYTNEIQTQAEVVVGDEVVATGNSWDMWQEWLRQREANGIY